MTGVAAPLPLPPPFPAPRVVEPGTATVDVLKRDILVNGSEMGVIDGNDNGVTDTPLGEDSDGTSTDGSVDITIGLILTVVVGEMSPPPGSVVGTPPLTGKPAASTQV